MIQFFSVVLTALLLFVSCPHSDNSSRTISSYTEDPSALFLFEKERIDESFFDEESWGKTSNGVPLSAFVSRLIDIAKAEPQFPVDHGKTKYADLFGSPYSAWCTEFVMFCLKQTETELGTSFIRDVWPWVDYSGACKTWFVQHHRWQPRGNGYVPSAGDLIVFDTVHRGGSDHTGLCIGTCVREDGTLCVVTMEGNIPQDEVKQVRSRILPTDDSIIVGYGSILVETIE